MNFFEAIINDENVNVNDMNLHFFVLKNRRYVNGHDIYDLVYGDPRLNIPILVAMKNDNMPILIANKIYHSNLWKDYMEKIRTTKLNFNIRYEYHAESLEALQNKLDEGQPNWKRGNPHVIDISKLEVYDLNDPIVVEKACNS